MAETGIEIRISNTELGSPSSVNSNSILIVTAKSEGSGAMRFELNKSYLVRSLEELQDLGITDGNNASLYSQVRDFFSPTTDRNITGTKLWLYGVATTYDPTKGQTGITKDNVIDAVRQTVVRSYDDRPRQILVSEEIDFNNFRNALKPNELQEAISQLYVEGFSTVGLLGVAIDKVEGDESESLTTADVSAAEDYSTKKSPLVGAVLMSENRGLLPSVAKIGGFMSSLSVGTSIGDASLPSFVTSSFLNVYSNGDESRFVQCSTLSKQVVDALGGKQYIFPRTRPPRNGLWLNDGATCESAITALSTLEAGRTIASIVDDLRSFFTPYINNRIPVTRSGDINPSYKQVVLDNARAKVITPYIESGDISDARITLKAKDNDMIGTRTWEVSVEILQAPTLRWIKGEVFYVKSL